MQELRVPKRAVRVELVEVGGAVLAGEVFLSEFAPGHLGEERLSDALGSCAFLPVRDLGRSRVVFVSCRNIVVARVAREVEAADDAAAHTIPTEHEVRVTLLGGQTLQGLLTYVLPPERARLIDFLNCCPAFLPLLEAEHLALVNREQIAQIEAL